MDFVCIVEHWLACACAVCMCRVHGTSARRLGLHHGDLASALVLEENGALCDVAATCATVHLSQHCRGHLSQVWKRSQILH